LVHAAAPTELSSVRGDSRLRSQFRWMHCRRHHPPPQDLEHERFSQANNSQKTSACEINTCKSCSWLLPLHIPRFEIRDFEDQQLGNGGRSSGNLHFKERWENFALPFVCIYAVRRESARHFFGVITYGLIGCFASGPLFQQRGHDFIAPVFFGRLSSLGPQDVDTFLKGSLVDLEIYPQLLNLRLSENSLDGLKRFTGWVLMQGHKAFVQHN